MDHKWIRSINEPTQLYTSKVTQTRSFTHLDLTVSRLAQEWSGLAERPKVDQKMAEERLVSLVTWPKYWESLGPPKWTVGQVARGPGPSHSSASPSFDPLESRNSLSTTQLYRLIRLTRRITQILDPWPECIGYSPRVIPPYFLSS